MRDCDERDRMKTLLVSLLFGFLHSLQGQFWVMLIASMILCQATLLTNSLLWATLLHAGWNTLTAVVTMPSGTQRVALAVAVAIAAVAGVLEFLQGIVVYGVPAGGHHDAETQAAGMADEFADVRSFGGFAAGHDNDFSFQGQQFVDMTHIINLLGVWAVS